MMQIKEKTLTEYADAFEIDHTGVQLSDIAAKLRDTAEKCGAKCNINMGEIVSKNWVSSRTYPCVAITHTKHEDYYFGFCITTRENGNFTIVNIYNFGNSDQMKADAILKEGLFTGNTMGGVAAGALRGGAAGLGFAAGTLTVGALRGGIKLMKKAVAAASADKNALADEKDWYNLIGRVLKETFFGE